MIRTATTSAPKPNGIAARALASVAVGGMLKYDAACRAVAEARSIDEAKDYRDQAEAMRAYAKQAKNKQLELDASEIRIRAERRIGVLMSEQRAAGHMATGGDATKARVADKPELMPPTLAEVGIDKNLADRARKYAAIPATEFEGIMAERRDRIQQEDERVTVSLMEAGDRHAPAPASARETLQQAWDAASEADRFDFLAANGLTFKKHVSPAVPTAKAKAGAGSSTAPATPRKTLSAAEQILLIRPNCKHAEDLDLCGGSGRNHCQACKAQIPMGDAA